MLLEIAGRVPSPRETRQIPLGPQSSSLSPIPPRPPKAPPFNADINVVKL